MELNIRELPGSLGEALDCFESDHAFLKPAFSNSLIETYVEIKRQEQLELNLRPHPYRVLQVPRPLTWRDAQPFQAPRPPRAREVR